MRLSVIARGRVKRTVPQLVRLACMLALVGLLVFAASIVYPKPLVVIFSMSIGHVIGMLAGAVYLLAIVLDTVRPGVVLEPATAGSDDHPELAPGDTVNDDDGAASSSKPR
ncbi:MAG TPA: hypothetical protein VFU02_02645 [Polyangiaceae bacterium]|nr:hypothetical protein [Polyangiaceae bacterium]